MLRYHYTRENTKLQYRLPLQWQGLRVQQGLSQEQLALRTEITPTYLGLIERNIKGDIVIQMLVCYNFTAADSDKRKLIERINKL